MSKYYYGQGCVSIAPVTNGVITGGFKEVGDADLLEINPSQEFLDIRESKSGARNKVKHLVTASEYQFNMQIKEITAENLTRAFYGTQSSSTAGTAVVEQVTAYSAGDVVPVSKVNLSNVSVGVNGGAGGDLVLDTDYSLNADTGSIKILAGHTHADLTGNGPWTLDITFDHGASESVAFAQEILKTYAIRFEGINVAEDGAPNIVTIHNVALNLSSTLSLIDTAEATLTIGGEALPDSNGDIVTYVQSA